MSFYKILGTILVALFLFGSLQTTKAQKSENKIGIGAIIGEPTGLSLKAWTSGTTAFDAGLAWSLGRYDAINIHADYLWHSFKPFNEIESGQLPIYYGVGGRIVFADNFPNQGDNQAIIGIRGPVGLNYLLEDAPIGLFLEVAPILNIVPETDFDVDGAIGIRFYL